MKVTKTNSNGYKKLIKTNDFPILYFKKLFFKRYNGISIFSPVN